MPTDPYYGQKNTTRQAVMCRLAGRIKDVENEVGLLEERLRVEPCGFSLGQALNAEVERLVSIMERLKSLNQRCEL